MKDKQFHSVANTIKCLNTFNVQYCSKTLFFKRVFHEITYA